MTLPNINAEFSKAASLLGNTTLYRESTIENPQAYSKSRSPQTQAQIQIKSADSDYVNSLLVLDETASPENLSLLILDFDDKQKTDDTTPLSEAIEYFKLPPTYIVKTPTGAGRHLYYYIPAAIANELAQVNLGYLFVANSPTPIELKLSQPNSKATIPMPGNQKNSGPYTLLSKSLSPQLAPPLLLGYLEKLAKQQKQQTIDRLNRNRIDCTSTVDAPQNINSALEYLLKQMTKRRNQLITEGNRNNHLRDMAFEVFTRNISLHEGTSLLAAYVNVYQVFAELIDEEEANATIRSIYDNVLETSRSRERGVDEILEPFPTTEDGFPLVTRALYIERITYLNTLQKRTLLSNDDYRRAYCETMVAQADCVIVPQKFPNSIFEEQFEIALTTEKPSWTQLAEDFLKIHLSFQEYTYSQFEKLFRLTRKSKTYSLSGHSDFSDYAFFDAMRIEKSHAFANSEYVFNDRTAYVGTFPPFYLKEKISTTDQEDLNRFYSIFRRNLTDEDFPEEFSFLLDRIAIILQRPQELADNFIILFGEGGTGKSLFYKLVASFFDPNSVNMYSTIKDALEKHANKSLISMIEELTPHDISTGALDFLKGESTSETITRNIKYQPITQEKSQSNFFFATNHEIEDIELIENRRTTILYSPNPCIEPTFLPLTQWIKEFLLGTHSQPLHGLRLFYTDLRNRKVTRSSWDFKSHYQKELIVQQTLNNDQVKGIVNLIANLGINSSDSRYPLTQADESTLVEDLTNANEFIVNNFDHLYLLTRYYPTMSDSSASINKHSFHRQKLVSWCNKNSLSRSLYSHNDLNKQRASAFSFGRTWTRALTPLSFLISVIDDHKIKMYGLSAHKEFLTENESITKEDVIEFLEEQYPDQTPGHINHISLLTSEEF